MKVSRIIGFGFGFMLPKIIKTALKIAVILGIGYVSTRGYEKRAKKTWVGRRNALIESLIREESRCLGKAAPSMQTNVTGRKVFLLSNASECVDWNYGEPVLHSHGCSVAPFVVRGLKQSSIIWLFLIGRIFRDAWIEARYKNAFSTSVGRAFSIEWGIWGRSCF